MITRDHLGPQQEIRDAHGGRASTLFYAYFDGKTDPSIRFADFVIKRGACLGYHQHRQTEEIVYVLSGEIEVFQEGSFCVLKPGDAALMKPGHPHAYRNLGDQDARVLGFFAAPGGRIDGEDLALPEEISHWIE